MVSLRYNPDVPAYKSPLRPRSLSLSQNGEILGYYPWVGINSIDIMGHCMYSRTFSNVVIIREDAYSRTGGIYITGYRIFIVIQWNMTLCMLHWITMNMPFHVWYPVWKCLPYGSAHPPYYVLLLILGATSHMSDCFSVERTNRRI